ncbi:LysR substrate-binding domain-containing protein [Halomonas sp. LY9]
MTREVGDEVGTLLRREPTVWVSAADHATHLQATVPLAMFEAPCFCRRHACNALDRAGKTYRVAYSSPSLATLQAVVGAGLAVSAWMQSLVTPDMLILGKQEGYPTLPEASIVLQRTSNTQSPIIDSLAEHIAEGFR